MKLSIITATLNSDPTIEHTITSIRNQTFKNVEHIFADGGSTDSTLKIIDKSNLTNHKVLSGLDNGVYDALNKGISLASGEIIGLLHSDDEYSYDTVLEDVMNIFKDQSIDYVYGDLVYVKKEDTSKIVRYWKSGYFKKSRMFRGWIPPHPTLFVRRSVLEKYGLYDTDFRISGDYEYMLRLFLNSKLKYKYLPKVLVHMRTGGISNKNLKSRVKANIEDRLAWKKNKISPRWYTFYLKPIRKIPQLFKSPPKAILRNSKRYIRNKNYFPQSF